MKKHIELIFLTVIAVLIFGCKSTVLPIATFTYVMQQDTIVFTNTTTGATSYSWDFGDKTTSTDKDPVHIYAASGSYTVTLTATNEDGSKTYYDIISLTKSLININGDFTDWSEIPTDKLFTSYVSDTATYKVLESLKVCVDDNYIYFYMKLDSSKVGPMDIYINSDNNPTTGSNNWLWKTCGGDYLIEGFLNVKLADATVFNFPASVKDQTSWGWVESAPSGSGVVAMSTPKTVNGKVVEFEGKIVRDLVTSQWATSIGFGVFTSNASWAVTGCLPGGGNAGDLMQVKIK